MKNVEITYALCLYTEDVKKNAANEKDDKKSYWTLRRTVTTNYCKVEGRTAALDLGRKLAQMDDGEFKP